MTAQKKPFVLSQDYEVVPPTQGIAYPIPKSNWDHIKSRINKLNKLDVDIYQNIGSCLLGLGFSALFCAITYPAQQGFTPLSVYFLLWVFGGVCTVVGVICWVFICTLNTIKKNEISEIIEEMEANEPQY
jgi:hypothetical protein